MKNSISKNDFQIAENRMNEILNLVTNKGGFDFLKKDEITELEAVTQIVKQYEDANFIIETPQTVQDIISFKMYEKKLRQKEIAKMLNTSDTKLSEIMNNKRKPNITFLKALNRVFGIDGNLLLKMV